MPSLELKVPPPVVALLVALSMWTLFRDTAPSAAAAGLRLPIAIALALGGVAFDVAGLLAFRRARTTINPLQPRSASSLVTTGVYRVTRNPMYVGLALLLLAWSAYLGSWWAAAGPFAFAAYISRFQIAPEERALCALFGAEYLAYKAKVRRWL